MLGKVLGEPVRGKLGDVPRIIGKGGGKYLEDHECA
jgi:hypothetical protein